MSTRSRRYRTRRVDPAARASRIAAGADSQTWCPGLRRRVLRGPDLGRLGPAVALCDGPTAGHSHRLVLEDFGAVPAPRLFVAVPEVMSRIVACKRETDSGTGALDQMVVAEYFSRNFDTHVGGLTQTLHDKLDTMVEAVEREFGTAVEKIWKPKGGIFLWLKLPDRVDVTKLVGPAAKAGLSSIRDLNGRAIRARANRICDSASHCRRKTTFAPGWRPSLASALRRPASRAERQYPPRCRQG